LQVDEPVAKAFGSEEKARLLAAAKARRSPHIYPALMLNLHAGLRDGEIRGSVGRIDLVKAVLVVGKAKTLAGRAGVRSIAMCSARSRSMRSGI